MEGHNYNILPLLGLALRGGNLAVGEDPVETAAAGRDARLILLASDAADNTRRRAERLAGIGQCLWTRLPCSKAELGHALGRSSAAVAAVTDIGLADALGRKLAGLDPDRYGELSRLLALKAKRAGERRAEREVRRKAAGTEKGRPKRAAEDRGPEREPLRRRPTGDKRTLRQAREAPDTDRPLRRRSDESGPPDGEKSRTAKGGPSDRGKTRTAKSGPSDRENPRSAKGGPSDGGKTRTAKGGPSDGGKSRTAKSGPPERRKAHGGPKPYAHSRPVKKGKGSFRKREDSTR